jgi:hypothetical protein
MPANPSPLADAPGDAFVVISPDGLFWAEQGWVDDWKKAQLFDGPVDPFTQAETLADQVRGLGFACLVAYVPRSVPSPAEPSRPRRDAKKKMSRPPPAR